MTTHPLETSPTFEIQLPTIYTLDHDGTVCLVGSDVPSVDYVLGRCGLLALIQTEPGGNLAWKFFTSYPKDRRELGRAFHRVYLHGLRRVTRIRASRDRVLITFGPKLKEGTQ